MKVRTLLVGLATAAVALAAPGTASAADEPIYSPMIVGGTNATQVYSFMVSLQSTSGGHFCGGSLIKANWVVTAAHCVQGKSPSSVQARIGTTNRTTGGTVARASRIVIHPSYNGNQDIALVQLSTSVSQTPIRISDTAGAFGTPTRIIGWGQTCPIRGACGAPITLQELNTKIAPDTECRAGFKASNEICTDNPNNNSGACYGDSGGPEVKSVGGRWELIGATSRAGGTTSTCAVDPSIYSDVTTYRSWIQGYTGPLA